MFKCVVHIFISVAEGKKTLHYVPNKSYTTFVVFSIIFL